MDVKRTYEEFVESGVRPVSAALLTVAETVDDFTFHLFSDVDYRGETLACSLSEISYTLLGMANGEPKPTTTADESPRQGNSPGCQTGPTVADINLLDWFAGQALPALISTASSPDTTGHFVRYEEGTSIVSAAREDGWGADCNGFFREDGSTYTYAGILASEAYEIALAMFDERRRCIDFLKNKGCTDNRPTV